MLDLKPLSKDAIPGALAKAERYRLLNEPGEAESICLDVLQIDADNQQALVILLLALTDQFDQSSSQTAIQQAREVLPRLHDPYERSYYAGIICERLARARFRLGGPGAGVIAYDGFREAMIWYEKAEALRPPHNDDAVLRWNACARFIRGNPHLAPVPEEKFEPYLE